MAYIGFILRVLIGVLFIYSSYSKFIDITIFEVNLVDFGLANWETSPYITRVIIGLEYVLGVYLVLGWFLKKYTIPIVSFSLIIFCIALGYMIYSGNADKNCGCFGASMSMSPIQAIYKNVIMLVILLLIYRLRSVFLFTLGTNYDRLIYWGIFVLLGTFLFITHPISSNLRQMDLQTVNYRPPLELLYSPKQNDRPKVNLKKGRWIAAFLSLKCKHCNDAAMKLSSIKRQNSEIPIYFILNGDKNLVDSFFVRNNVENIDLSGITQSRVNRYKKLTVNAIGCFFALFIWTGIAHIFNILG